MSKYSREINLGDSNAADTKIIHLVGKNKKVLEFGCAGGHMSKVLKEKCGCEVVGVEINAQDAEMARAYCKDVIVGDIEDLAWCEKLAGAQFDVAIFADVLEHLKRPERPLEKVREFLKDNGCVLVSVPNIANVSIRLELLSGGFEYEDLGILDDTHLKYFTLKSIINLIESAKLYVDSVDYSTKDLPDKVIAEQLKPLGLRATKKTIKNFGTVEAIAYEFILKANKRKPKGYVPYKFKETKKPQRIMEEVFEEQAKQSREKDKHIANLEAGLLDYKRHTQSLESERSDRKRHIANIEKERKDRNLHLKNLEKERKEREVHIGKLEKERKAGRSEIEALKKEREDRDRHISNLEKEQTLDKAEVLRLQGVIAERDDDIKHFCRQNESLQRDLESERLRISLLLNSREWKLMAPARWVFRFIRKLRVKIVTKFYPLNWEYRAIKKSGLFDATYYIDRNQDVKKLNMNPLVHYVKYGVKEGRHPHPLFDSHYYLAQNRDVAKFRINPLAHFVKYGVREERDPNLLFDVGYYLAQNPDVAESGVNPVAHYLEIGAGKGVNPSPLFDSNNYLAHNPDVAVSGMNPLVHFVLYGAKEGRNPKPEPNKQIDSAESSAPLKSVEKIVYSSESGDVWKDATVSVIVPTLNAADDFATFLPVFKNQKGLQHIEIVVVDSGSTDNTVELAKKFGARTIRIPPEAFSHSYARNLGAEHASGNYFLFITQDALPPSESWLHEMLSALKKSEAIAVSCAEFPREDVDLFYRISSWHHHRIMEFDKVDRLLSMPDVEDYLTLRKNAQLSDTACLISGDLFMKYKFRNDYAEDLDLGLRLIRDGYKLAFLCSTKIIHSHNRLPYYYLKRAYVDNLTLGQIFPDLQIPHIRIDEFARDILHTYDIVNCLVREDLHGLTMPCNIETFITAIKTKLGSTHSYGGLASEGISNNNYVDKDFKSFLRKIGSRYSVEEGIGYDGMLVHAIIAFVDVAVNYMSETYETIDDNILHDFNACLYKAFAYQVGAHLCFCHLSASDEKTKEVFKIVSDLTKGI